MDREEIIIHTLKKRGINVALETDELIVLSDGTSVVLIEKEVRGVTITKGHKFFASELLLIAELALGKGDDHGDGFI